MSGARLSIHGPLAIPNIEGENARTIVGHGQTLRLEGLREGEDGGGDRDAQRTEENRRLGAETAAQLRARSGKDVGQLRGAPVKRGCMGARASGSTEAASASTRWSRSENRQAERR